MAARSNWIADPVHPSAHSYAKMSLNLLEAIAPTGTVAKHNNSSRKWKRSETDHSGISNGSRDRARAWSDSKQASHSAGVPHNFQHNNPLGGYGSHPSHSSGYRGTPSRGARGYGGLGGGGGRGRQGRWGRW
jgi:hypothetical protein